MSFDPKRYDAHISNSITILRLAVLISLIVFGLGVNISAQDLSPAEERLAGVDTWFYYILIDETVDDVIEQVVASDYDMVVIDPIITERDSTDHDIQSAVNAIQESGKIVIAYIDIGQAEDYRIYWQNDWQVGDPEWIVSEDPDGWTGNYPVAYWWDEWREIWLDENEGLLQLLLDIGFDGIYLDWVEAYSDEDVVAFAQQDGVDATQEMIWFVSDLSEYGKSQRSDFIVISQNAAELAEYDEYLAVIDAISQEQTWFDGAAEGVEGDCPLPATDTNIDTDAYYQSLAAECQELYTLFPESTLHVSSQEYLYYLTMARDKGEIIFTVDYALQAENVAWIYETSRSYGFVPFVGPRPLNRYLPPFEG